MIEDARRIPHGSHIAADLCIIGGGAAGITIAREMASTGRNVVLLVGGGARERAADRDLYRGSAAPGTSHEPLEENRRRCWGGTTTAWGGRCVPFDPIDFEPRDHVAHSGWPLNYGEMLPFYRRANEVCEAGEFSYDAEAALPGQQAEVIVGFDGDEVVSTHIERWSPPTQFGRRYRKDLQRAGNVRVLMHAHATQLQLADDTQRVISVHGATTPGHQFAVEADEYVLACGGLENPRLLLASNDVEPSGIGNRHGNVGRYYMTHLMGVVASVEFPEGLEKLSYGFERDPEGVYCRRRIWVSPQAQERSGIANAVAFFYRPNISDAGHRNALFSSTYLAKAYMGAFRKREPRRIWETLRADRGARREHWRVVIRDLPRAVPQAVRLFQQRWLVKRRLPSVLGTPSGTQIELFYHTEHVPNPDSRVELDSTCDDFGLPRLRAHIAFSQLDFDTVLTFHDMVARQLDHSGVGKLRYDCEDPRLKLADHTTHFNSQGHHLGTTRMSVRPEDGVVDPNCRVHGVDNLFVAGGSVFPTGSHANPTLTIVALAIRLAEHLRHGSRKAVPPHPPASTSPA